MTSPQTEQFVAAIRAGLGPNVNEDHEPVTGWQWTWTCRGVWTLTVGGLLTPEPRLVGPAGRWTMNSTALDQADLVMLLIHLANAMPAPAAAKSRPEPALQVVAGGGTRVLLVPCGPPVGNMQQVATPSGGAAMVVLSETSRISETLDDGTLGILIVEPVTADWRPGQPIPATLHTSEPVAL